MTKCRKWLTAKDQITGSAYRSCVGQLTITNLKCQSGLVYPTADGERGQVLIVIVGYLLAVQMPCWSVHLLICHTCQQHSSSLILKDKRSSYLFKLHQSTAMLSASTRSERPFFMIGKRDCPNLPKDHILSASWRGKSFRLTISLGLAEQPV